ncbi:protein kinase [Streptomyces sp. NBC_00536]|uniref:serine/threonine-protein kinase n=1 Tax=Streptomyces sp. NBC_00536 TaxID=2975769 RepID=UPI002E816FDD|nr:protein kinase [Streptomyces sp. NBC_00536]WUC80315.1 protein kinase [Streptomyces sp. NBC_00536]
MDALRETDPTRIGVHVLVARLGAGGMGQVYLGRSPGGRLVAVKVVREEILGHPQALARFRREANTVREVRSAYTARLIDASLEQAPYWLATEYVAGPTLAHAVQDRGALPADTCRALGAALAEGLAGVHEQGVTHRDVKPQNVILGAQGPQLIDFGIARGVGVTALTQEGQSPGTPGFTAPEVLLGAAGEAPADVFALGALLAYAATGRPPFGAGEAASVWYRTVHEPVDAAGVEPGLAALIEACVAKDPAARPSPAEVIRRCGVARALVDDPVYAELVAPPGSLPGSLREAIPGAVHPVATRVLPDPDRVPQPVVGPGPRPSPVATPEAEPYPESEPRSGTFPGPVAGAGTGPEHGPIPVSGPEPGRVPDSAADQGPGRGPGAEPIARPDTGSVADPSAGRVPGRVLDSPDGDTAASEAPAGPQRRRGRGWVGGVLALAVVGAVGYWQFPVGGGGDGAGAGGGAGASAGARTPDGKASASPGKGKAKAGPPADHIEQSRTSRERWTLDKDPEMAKYGSGLCNEVSGEEDAPGTGMESSTVSTHTNGVPGKTMTVKMRPKGAGDPDRGTRPAPYYVAVAVKSPSQVAAGGLGATSVPVDIYENWDSGEYLELTYPTQFRTYTDGKGAGAPALASDRGDWTVVFYHVEDDPKKYARIACSGFRVG